MSKDTSVPDLQEPRHGILDEVERRIVEVEHVVDVARRRLRDRDQRRIRGGRDVGGEGAR